MRSTDIDAVQEIRGRQPHQASDRVDLSSIKAADPKTAAVNGGWAGIAASMYKGEDAVRPYF
jgi:hypothetical protein